MSWQMQRRPHRRRCLGLRNIVNIVGEDTYTHVRMHALTYTHIRTPTSQPALMTRIHSYPHTHIRNIHLHTCLHMHTHLRYLLYPNLPPTIPLLYLYFTPTLPLCYPYFTLLYPYVTPSTPLPPVPPTFPPPTHAPPRVWVGGSRGKVGSKVGGKMGKQE